MKIFEVTDQDIFYNKLVGFTNPMFFVEVFKKYKDMSTVKAVMQKIKGMLTQHGASRNDYSSYAIGDTYFVFEPYTDVPKLSYGIIISVGTINPVPTELYKVNWRQSNQVVTIVNYETRTKEQIQL